VYYQNTEDYSSMQLKGPFKMLFKKYKFYKQNKGDTIWWVDTSDYDGLWLFSFNRKTIYNMFEDYPNNLTPEEKEIFDRENPYWKEFFSDRI